MRIVKVKFLSTKDSQTTNSYYYKDMQPRKLNKWDTVLVPTRYGHSLAVVQDTYSSWADAAEGKGFSGWGLHIDAVKTVSEKIKSKVVDEELKLEKADAIKRQLDAEIKKVDEITKYEMYTKSNPEIAKLLEQLKALQG